MKKQCEVAVISNSNLEKYSFSKISSFHTCLVGFIFTYILKQEQVSNGMSEFGSFCHSLLEKWAKGELEIYELLTEYENNYKDNVTSSFPRLRNGVDMGDAYYDDAYNFFSTFDGIGDYEIIGVEEHFEIQIDDFIFNGFIDLILKDKDGNLIVFDWKSKKEFKDDEEEMKYRRQLYLYSYYLYEKHGKHPVSTIFYCFRKQKKYERKFDEKAYEESIKWMFDTVAEIRKLYCSYDYFFCSQLCSSRNICKMKKEVESNSNWKDIIKKQKKLEK